MISDIKYLVIYTMNILQKGIYNIKKTGQAGLNLALSIGLVIFVMAGFVIGLGAFASSTTNANATSFINQGITMFSNLGSQFGTIGTLIGVGLLIAVIAGAFVVGSVAKNRGGF